MRNRTMILIGALLLVSAAARAQQQQPSATAPAATQTTPAAAPAATPESPRFGRIDFGFRGDSVDGDQARYQRFRDLRDGAFLDGLRYQRETESWLFRGEANNVGYRDQRYFAGYESIGKLKTTFEWNQVPLFISNDSRSIWKDQGGGVLAIDDAIQQSIQNATALGNAARDTAINAAMAQAAQVDLRSRRDNANFNLVYTLNRDVDVKFNLRNSKRSGNNIHAFGFGTSPGLNPAVEIGVPMDDRTTDVRGALEFANQKAFLSVGYNGSWFDNQIPYVRFDNPLRAQDINNGPSVGGAVMWPSNSTFNVNASGSYRIAPKTRASAAISFGQATQDERLAIATPNTALVAPTYERATTEGKADVVTMLYALTARPTAALSLNARYRYYDYDNKTPHWSTTTLIGDWTVGTGIWENEPNSFKRKTLDLDASYSPMPFVSFSAGFGREDADRTFRIFEKTAENVFRVSADSTGNQYVTVRAKYEYSRREGSHFDEELLDEVGEQPETRHFDVADRKRGRFTTSIVVTPVEIFAINGTASWGKDDYDRTGFGLRDNENNAFSVGFDVTPTDMVSFGLNYGREKYTAFQYSRTALPAGNAGGPLQFFDPTRDWSIDSDDKVNTFTASLDLIKALPKTDIRFSYDLSDGKATYVYGGPALTNASVFPTVPVAQLAPIDNKLTSAKADVQYFVRPNVALGLAYWYEDYQVKDFALGDTTLNTLSPANASTGVFASTIYSGYLYRPYTANTVWLRMSYLW